MKDFIQNSTKKVKRIDFQREKHCQSPPHSPHTSPHHPSALKRKSILKTAPITSQASPIPQSQKKKNFIIEYGHKANVENVKHLKAIVSNEINIKMQNYKLNSPAPHTILNYIQQQFNKKHDFYYNFLEESDPTTLKVLIQILYEQIESQCINFAIRDQEAHKRQVGVENIHPDRLAERQHKDAELKYHLKEFEDAHGLERERLRLEMED
jgi:hypothetical protein